MSKDYTLCVIIVMSCQDQQYPYIETPSILCNLDNVVNSLFRKELRAKGPEMFKWRWLEGITTSVGTPRDEFRDQMLWHINQKYKVGTGRIVESCERSSAINFVDLGNGYRLHCSGFDPKRMQRADKHIFLFDWLYKQANPQGKSSNDGTKRLRGLIEWMNQCPSNPYNIVLFLPVGEDLLEKYAPHYKALGYVKTNHSTLDLRQIYRFWLKGVETELSPRDTLAGNYWRSDLYKPQNSIYSVVGCIMPEVLLNK